MLNVSHRVKIAGQILECVKHLTCFRGTSFSVMRHRGNNFSQTPETLQVAGRGAVAQSVERPKGPSLLQHYTDWEKKLLQVPD